eukprot:470717-Rhodomonas_salina.1
MPGEQRRTFPTGASHINAARLYDHHSDPCKSALELLSGIPRGSRPIFLSRVSGHKNMNMMSFEQVSIGMLCRCVLWSLLGMDPGFKLDFESCGNKPDAGRGDRGRHVRHKLHRRWAQPMHLRFALVPFGLQEAIMSVSAAAMLLRCG